MAYKSDAEAGAALRIEPRAIGRAEIEAAILRGREIRSRMMRNAVSGLGQRLSRMFPGRRAAARTGLHEDLHTPLTAIRSAAEILRDEQGLTAEERRRFIGIVLQEERRLERLVSALTAHKNRVAAG